MKKQKDDEFFRAIRDNMLEGIEAIRTGKELTRREVTIPDPPRSMSPGEIAALRRGRFGVSQFVFARILNVSAQTVQAWEQGRNIPSGAALRLLRVAERAPENVLPEAAGRRRRRETILADNNRPKRRKTRRS